MCLAVWPLTGFSGLLQILLLIVSAFLVTAFMITVVLHYRRRKKEPEPADVEQIINSKKYFCERPNRSRTWADKKRITTTIYKQIDFFYHKCALIFNASIQH